MTELDTLRKYELRLDDNGLMSVPVDICFADGSGLSKRSFHLSTGAACCTMRADDLRTLGYDPSAAVTLRLLRIGLYDFVNIPVIAAETNTIGANVLKWLNFSVSNTENLFEVDLIRRLKPIVEKGINPNIKAAYMSKLKPSIHNDNYNWYTWEEIDTLFPDSWVLILGLADEPEYGGEILWHSEDDVPDTSQANTFLYCNKSVAKKKPFMVQFENYVRCRGFAKPDAAFSTRIEELEAHLAPPIIDRFYYDATSKQGKLFTMSKGSAKTNSNPDAVLTQDAIDELFAELVW